MARAERSNSDIDGGWAWVILITSFLSLMLVCGALYSVSVFNVIFLEVFHTSKARTSFIGSVLIGLIAFMGPVSSALSNRYGWRIPVMIGGFIAALGTFLASFSQNMTHLILTYGIISGIGHGLCYTPAIVVVGYYFEKYRTMASGFASVGAGVGMMVFPPLIRFLRIHCTWRELLVYISCLYAQITVLGALMRPLTKRREDVIIPDIVEEQPAEKQQESNQTESENNDDCDGDIVTEDITSDVDLCDENMNCDGDLTQCNNSESLLASENNHINELDTRMSHEKDKYDVISISSSITTTPCHCSKIGLYFGTCCSYSRNCACSKARSTKHKHSDKFKLISGSFIVFCASIFTFGVGLSALYVHLSAFAISHGATETESSFLVTLLGISSIISRVITGVAGNDSSIDNTILYIGAFGIAGISTMLCPCIATTYYGRVTFTLFFGFYGSCFNVLLAPLTVEIIGLNHLSTAFGVEMVVNGVAYFLGPPLAGLLYDVTESYNTSFFLAGSCLMTSSVVMMFVSVFNQAPQVKDLYVKDSPKAVETLKQTGGHNKRSAVVKRIPAY